MYYIYSINVVSTVAKGAYVAAQSFGQQVM